MPGNFVERRPVQTNWGALGESIVAPFNERRQQENELKKLMFVATLKSKMEQQSKINEIALRQAYAEKMHDKLVNSGNGPMGDFKIEYDEYGIPKSYSQKSAKEKNEELAIDRSSKLGSVLSYIQKAAQQGAPSTVYKQAAEKYSTPEEIKNIMSAYNQGAKLRPKATPSLRPTTQSITTGSGAEEVLKEIGDLKSILQKEPNSWMAKIPVVGRSAQARGVKLPFFAPYGISEKGQEYRTLRESINNRLLYLRSGAQINDKEYRRLSGMLPEIFRSDKVDLQQLNRFESEFKNIQKRLGGKQSIANDFSNMSDDELKKIAGM